MSSRPIAETRGGPVGLQAASSATAGSRSRPTTSLAAIRDSLPGSLEERLAINCERFLKRWGPTTWRDQIERVGPLATADEDLLSVLDAAGAVELDADLVYRHKLRPLGVLRSPVVRQIMDVWLVEEMDHHRIFRALIGRLRGTAESAVEPEHNLLTRDPRALLAVPTLIAVRPFRQAALAGLFVRGVCVELTAMAVYQTLQQRLLGRGQEVAAEIVRGILMQEARHLKVFERCATTILDSKPRMAAAVRIATERYWRPPGVDLMGEKEWSARFRPILTDPEFIAGLRRIDQRIGQLPGFEHTTMVSAYMRNARSCAEDVG